MKKLFLFILIAGLAGFAGLTSFPSVGHARAAGPYIGGGYQQPLMFSWKSQSNFAPNPGSKLSFWPGFGMYIVGGYEFDKPDWFGLAMPVSWSLIKVNKAEWAHMINVDAEAIFHFMEPDQKLDPYVAALAGFNYMTEGKTSNGSKSLGPDFGAAFGLKYTILEYAKAGSPGVTNLSFHAEVPVKIILFINDEELSPSKTTPVIAVPVRFGLTYSF